MEEVEIAVLIALDEEYQTWRQTLTLSPIRSIDRYHFFELPSSVADQSTRVVVYVIGEMGLIPATTSTDELLNRVRPKWLVSIGLAGQLSSDCAMGDVVIATDCDLAYSEARLSEEKIKFAGKTFELPALKAFLSSVDLSKFLQGRELTLQTAGRKLLEERKLWRKFPYLHSGVVCSTDFVVDSPKKKAELLDKNRRFLCTDMESAAMVAAARRRGFDGEVAIIRGISDPADGTKKEIDKLSGSGLLRKYAMRNATTVLLHSVVGHFLPSTTRSFANGPIVMEFIQRLGEVSQQLAASTLPLADTVAQIDIDQSCRDLDTDLAKYVYRARIAKLDSEVPKSLAHEISKSTLLPAVNYFVALHVMRALGVGFENVPEQLTPLTHVHTNEVNQFCKAFLESTPRIGNIFRLMDRIRAAYDHSNKIDLDPAAKSNLQAHLCYLLGRITGEQPAQQAKLILGRWREQLLISAGEKKRRSSAKLQPCFQTEVLERLTREQLLQFRTIQISLVQLGAATESDNYITSCISSKKLDAQNRGFHLEYYGDITYDSSQPLNNEDKLESCPKTLQILGNKLLSSFKRGNTYPLRDIELFTVISLLQSRLERGKLMESDRISGHEILLKASWGSSSDLFSRLKDRLIMDLSKPAFRPQDILTEIYSLKKLPRTGWNARGRKVTYPESVASHTFGGLTLIEFFLPETKSPEAKDLGSGYSKEAVLRLFLKHDWAEAHIGDLLPDQKTEEALTKEDSTFRTLDSSFVYSPFVNRSIYEDWLEFERGDSINSRLARDIDQLDNLEQLLIEMSTPESIVPDAEEWIAHIEKRIRTPLGRRLFSFLIDRK